MKDFARALSQRCGFDLRACTSAVPNPGRGVARQAAPPLRHARQLLDREINPTVYTPAEFDKKRATKNRLLAEVLDKPKLIVIGRGAEAVKPGWED